MPTNDERREVAARLRALDVWEFDEGECIDQGDVENALGIINVDGAWCEAEGVMRLADLIEPEERTCNIEPLSLHELFAGEKHILSSDARESAESERFDRISRELEEDARFTCSNCHVLFGTHEVANADYDILEDGTYEVSGIVPSINFCPFCGAKVIRDA